MNETIALLKQISIYFAFFVQLWFLSHKLEKSLACLNTHTYIHIYTHKHTYALDIWREEWCINVIMGFPSLNWRCSGNACSWWSEYPLQSHWLPTKVKEWRDMGPNPIRMLGRTLLTSKSHVREGTIIIIAQRVMSEGTLVSYQTSPSLVPRPYPAL